MIYGSFHPLFVALNWQGYEVLEAEDGLDGLAVYRLQTEAIEAVLLRWTHGENERL